MTTTAQKKANAHYRAKLAERGLVRLEIIVPEKNRDMMKALAEQLTLAAKEAEQGRAPTSDAPSGAQIWTSLHDAPRLDELDFDRSDFQLRPVDL